MRTYTVRTGQNIFDVALTLYGSIEGVFDLLISNPEGFNGGALSMTTQLKSGMILNYHEEYIINPDIAKWVEDEELRIKNGSHVYQYTDVQESIIAHIQKFDDDLIAKACAQWPGVYADGKLLENADTVNRPLFLRYINAFYIGPGDTELEVEAKKSVYGNEDVGIRPSSTDEVSIWWDEACAARLLVQQQGVLSSISMRIHPKSVMVIDWGDATVPEIYSYTQETITTEHNYEGDGEHTIRIYGNFSLYSLDLTQISGMYYALAPIVVEEEFLNNFPDNPTINKLFTKK